MKKKFEIIPPIMPNYVRFRMPPGKRQDGFQSKPGSQMPITDFSKEEAEEFGELMKQAFIEHWKNLSK